MLQIEKLNNPFEEIGPGYNCFGCSPNNPKGLHLHFYRYNNKLLARWQPDSNLQGYHNLLHGGIQATILDETASWWVYSVGGTAGFTSRLAIRYRKGVSAIDGDVYAISSLISKNRNLYRMDVRLYNNNLELSSTAEAEFFTYPIEKAKESMYYPGIEKFAGITLPLNQHGLPHDLADLLA